MIAAEHILMLLNSADAITPGVRAFSGASRRLGTCRAGSLTGAWPNGIFEGYSGHRVAMALNGSGANDPRRSLWRAASGRRSERMQGSDAE
jgi:hypothetical protein